MGRKKSDGSATVIHPVTGYPVLVSVGDMIHPQGCTRHLHRVESVSRGTIYTRTRAGEGIMRPIMASEALGWRLAI